MSQTELTATQPASLGGPLLETVDLAKSFGETKALVSCSLALVPGEIHALCGENGSGKSTLVKLLSGVLRPDAGTVRRDGAEVSFAKPKHSMSAGIATVFQETLVVPELSVRDNILIGTGRMFRHGSGRDAELAQAENALATMGVRDIRLDVPMWTLSLAQQQLVTVARALSRKPAVLILDESTSALDINDLEHLFETLDTARAGGMAILYISHRMDEIRRLADRLTVLRSGRSLATLPVSEAPTDLVLRMMAPGWAPGDLRDSSPGDRSGVPHYERRRRPTRDDETVLVASDVVLRRGADPFDLDVKRGEILGVAGLEGHGQAEFLEAIVGLKRPLQGRLEVGGGSGMRRPKSLNNAFRAGIAYVPRSRKEEGIFPSMSVLDNLFLPLLGRFTSAGLLSRRRLRKAGREMTERMKVNAPGLDVPITALSGGNQQKVLLGRWIGADPRLLVLNDPLRGVDLGSKLDLYSIFRDVADQGMSLVFLSTEVEELVLIADRVAVFHAGSLFKVIEGDHVENQEIVDAMFGTTDIAESSDRG
jgi:ABC-type sugar transport system ATPase subunit